MHRERAFGSGLRKRGQLTSWLNKTTVTLGIQNVFDEDPPFVTGNFENGYHESLATIKGRFWYVH